MACHAREVPEFMACHAWDSVGKLKTRTYQGMNASQTVSALSITLSRLLNRAINAPVSIKTDFGTRGHPSNICPHWRTGLRVCFHHPKSHCHPGKESLVFPPFFLMASHGLRFPPRSHAHGKPWTPFFVSFPRAWQAMNSVFRPVPTPGARERKKSSVL